MKLDLIIESVQSGINTDPNAIQLVEALLASQSKCQTLENKTKMLSVWMRNVRSPISNQVLSILG